VNAPISAALLQLRASNVAPVITFAQPQVPAGMRQLMAGYLLHGVYVDLYGMADAADGCAVEAVAPAGTRLNLVSLFSHAELAQMERAVDRAGVEARAASRAEGGADRAAWDKAAMS
jgi:hypothetical protein